MPAITPPTNLQASVQSATSIYLTWTNTNYSLPIEIWLKQSGGIYQYWGQADAGKIGYTVRGLSPDTYYYFKVRYANSTLFSTEDSEYTLPTAPSGLTVAVSGVELSLSWTNESNYQYIKIDYYNDASGWQSVDTVSGTTTSYEYTASEELTSYLFRITGAGQVSAYWSDYAISDAVSTELATPTGLEATCPSSTSVLLTWEDNSSVEEGYEVYQDNSLIYTTNANEESYLVNGLTTDETYTFKVRAKNGTNYSPFSDEVSIRVGIAPDADPVLTAVASGGQTSLDLTWTCAATNETGYEVWRSLDNTTYTKIATISNPTATSYSDTGLTSNTLYYYKVRAYNDYGYSGFSSAMSGTTDANLDAPTNLMATALSSTSIRLDWTVNATDATAHYIERKSGLSAWSVVGYTSTGTDSYYVDGTVSADTSYVYRVRAYNALLASFGAYSVSVTCKTPVSEELLIKDEPYIGMGSHICIITEEPTTQFDSYWRSKPLDFAEIDPKLPSRFKTVDRVRLDYVDKYANIPVTVGLSVDDGKTWTEETLTLGEGDGTSKHADFWFEPVTGRTISVRVKHSDSDTAFEWTGLTLYFLVRGDAV